MPRITALLFFAATAILSATATAQDLLWMRQLGSIGHDYCMGVALDGKGNPYIGGTTLGAIGNPSHGNRDAFLAKYSAAGNRLWAHQLGTSMSDSGTAIAADAPGNAYISGSTEGSLGGPNAGGSDAFLAKYDALGSQRWVRQVGSSANDLGNGVAVDGAGHEYLVGTTFGDVGGTNAGGSDVFLAKYDAAGNLFWTRQLGSGADDSGQAVAVDGAGNAYICGFRFGDLGGPSAGDFDAFVAKYDTQGVLLWTRQLGSATDDRGAAIAVDGAGNAYIAGTTFGSVGGPSAGGFDAFLAKFDTQGALLWTRQLGTPAAEYATGVAVDSAGNACIGGYTYGSLDGPSAGSYDAFLAKYDAKGNRLWTRQLGTWTVEYARGVAMDGAGTAYIGGSTQGSLGGPSVGENDVFLAKYGAACPADLDDDGDFANGGHPEGAVTIEDLCYFLSGFETGSVAVDLDNGSGTGVHDGAVTIDDLLYFLAHFEAGC